MNILAFSLLVLVASITGAEETSVLRGKPSDVGTPGRNHHPPDKSNLRADSVIVLAKLDLSVNASIEFLEVDGDILISALARAGSEDGEILNSVFQDEGNDPIKVFKKLMPDEEIPAELVQAKWRIDKSKKEEEDNPTTYANNPSAVVFPEPYQEGGQRRLSLNLDSCAGDCSKPDYPVGSHYWWELEYCSSDSIDINEDKCACYTYITGDYSYHASDDNMLAHVYPYKGGLGLAAYNWKCGLFSCKWKYTGYSVWVPEGYVGKVWTSGSTKWRQARTYSASGDEYHFSYYTWPYSDEQTVCTTGSWIPCYSCPNKNW